MKKFYKIFLLLGVLICASNAYAQNQTDMRINEVLVTNTMGYMDDYGYRNGWIELFNTSYGTVNIAGCYLTTDPSNLTMYKIPSGDPKTQIQPQQFAVFYADGESRRGTFHLGFKIDSTTKVILFVGGDGKTVIDKVELPQLAADQAYGRFNDGQGTPVKPSWFYQSVYNNKKFEAGNVEGTNFGWLKIDMPTPGTNNTDTYGKTKSETMAEADPWGTFLTLTAMCVTFFALILLYFVFKNVGKYNIRRSSEKAKEATAGSLIVSAKATSGEVPASVYAAISMALHLYRTDNEAHDFENTVLTIHKESKTYSPWSSKIYTLRETPQVNKRK